MITSSGLPVKLIGASLTCVLSDAAKVIFFVADIISLVLTSCYGELDTFRHKTTSGVMISGHLVDVSPIFALLLVLFFGFLALLNAPPC